MNCYLIKCIDDYSSTVELKEYAIYLVRKFDWRTLLFVHIYDRDTKKNLSQGYMFSKTRFVVVGEGEL